MSLLLFETRKRSDCSHCCFQSGSGDSIAVCPNQTSRDSGQQAPCVPPKSQRKHRARIRPHWRHRSLAALKGSGCRHVPGQLSLGTQTPLSPKRPSKASNWVRKFEAPALQSWEVPGMQPLRPRGVRLLGASGLSDSWCPSLSCLSGLRQSQKQAGKQLPRCVRASLEHTAPMVGLGLRPVRKMAVRILVAAPSHGPHSQQGGEPPKSRLLG